MRRSVFWLWCCALAAVMLWARGRTPEGEPPPRALFEERHRLSYDIFAASSESQAYDLLASAFGGAELDRQFGFYAQAARQLADAAATVTVWDLSYQHFSVLSVDGDSCRVRAKWTVFFVLGHEQHSHIRGNAYDAIFELRRQAGGWRIVRTEIVGDNTLA